MQFEGISYPLFKLFCLLFWFPGFHCQPKGICKFSACCSIVPRTTICLPHCRCGCGYRPLSSHRWWCLRSCVGIDSHRLGSTFGKWHLPSAASWSCFSGWTLTIPVSFKLDFELNVSCGGSCCLTLDSFCNITSTSQKPVSGSFCFEFLRGRWEFWQ